MVKNSFYSISLLYRPPPILACFWGGAGGDASINISLNQKMTGLWT